MKTFRDLKIGDKVFFLSNRHIVAICEVFYIVSNKDDCLYISATNIFDGVKYSFCTTSINNSSYLINYGSYYTTVYADEKVFLHDFKRYENI